MIKILNIMVDFSSFIRCLILLIFSVTIVSCEKKHEVGSYNLSIHFKLPVKLSGNGSDSSIYYDNSVLMLPNSYTTNKYSELIIYCHSGGGGVTSNSSEAEQETIIKYFISQGYAVLSVGGLPKAYSDLLKIDNYRNVGWSSSIKMYESAYLYTIKNFKINSKYCFLYSNSNGGLIASNLVNFSNIPIVAQAGLSPLISIEKNAWNIPTGAYSGGEYENLQNRANIIRLYRMKDVHNIDQLKVAKYSKVNVGKYDPFDFLLNQSTSKYRIPYLIIQSSKDVVVSHSIAVTFANASNIRGGQIIVEDSDDLGGHNVIMTPTIIGAFFYENKSYPISIMMKKIVEFYKKNKI